MYGAVRARHQQAVRQHQHQSQQRTQIAVHHVLRRIGASHAAQSMISSRISQIHAGQTRYVNNRMAGAGYVGGGHSARITYYYQMQARRNGGGGGGGGSASSSSTSSSSSNSQTHGIHGSREDHSSAPPLFVEERECFVCKKAYPITSTQVKDGEKAKPKVEEGKASAPQPAAGNVSDEEDGVIIDVVDVKPASTAAVSSTATGEDRTPRILFCMHSLCTSCVLARMKCVDVTTEEDEKKEAGEISSASSVKPQTQQPKTKKEQRYLLCACSRPHIFYDATASKGGRMADRELVEEMPSFLVSEPKKVEEKKEEEGKAAVPASATTPADAAKVAPLPEAAGVSSPPPAATTEAVSAVPVDPITSIRDLLTSYRTVCTDPTKASEQVAEHTKALDAFKTEEESIVKAQAELAARIAKLEQDKWRASLQYEMGKIMKKERLQRLKELEEKVEKVKKENGNPESALPSIPILQQEQDDFLAIYNGDNGTGVNSPLAKILDELTWLDSSARASLMSFLLTSGIDLSASSGCNPISLYRSTRDGKTRQDFFECTAGWGPTLTLCRVQGNDYIFGVFTVPAFGIPPEKGEAPESIADPSGKTFIFSLVNGAKVPFRLVLKESAKEHALYSHPLLGASWGREQTSSSGQLEKILTLVLQRGDGRSVYDDVSGCLAMWHKEGKEEMSAYEVDKEGCGGVPLPDGFKYDEKTLAGKAEFSCKDVEVIGL